MAYSNAEIRQEWLAETNKRKRLSTNSKSDKSFKLSDCKRLGNTVRVRRVRNV